MGKFISLGHNCAVRHFLDKYRFPQPTDHWRSIEGMLSFQLNDVCDLLEYKHSGFFQLENLSITGSHIRIFRETTKEFHIVQDQFTGLRSVHDFPIECSIEDRLDAFHKKMAIKDFISDVKSLPHPIFIRTNNGKEKIETIIRLYDVIGGVRGNKDYTVVVFQSEPSWPIGFYVRNLEVYQCDCWVYRSGWVGNEDLWLKLLKRRDISRSGLMM